jgi:hypothetical protein
MGKGKKEDKPSPQCELSNLWGKNRKKKLDKKGNGPLLTIHYQCTIHQNANNLETSISQNNFEV